MADYHFVYKDVEGASTQWDDIQRKLGNLPPKPPAFKPDPFAPAEDEDSKPKNKTWIDNKTEEELEDLEDDLDDDRFLEEYRRKRLVEMKQMVKIAKFGSVVPISGSDFVRESDPVLNDGQSEGEASREAVLEGVRKRFIEKVITHHENDDDDGSSSE
ncbi:Phosducin, thioredoxin-like domain-containing protein [Cynara cardunculus var. scolymus]|uniref:Phosducin, thioredoxin-like domain-containing protein n=1 Tax=Cynara cardunculus var. scolymus TaxID=59895 RepID=A0A118GQ29_CYNCS|nr:Phosducin, thioredoxin-like domain-containing protein [Cynara cardunculus var. scolymus]